VLFLCFLSIIEKKIKNMRNKIPDEKKKEKMTLTIDENIAEILEKYLEDNNIKNKSKYIESLIRKDMQERGKNINREF
jgi:hypothetical protein